MGLLNKAIASTSAGGGSTHAGANIHAVISDFNHTNAFFHGIVLSGTARHYTDMLAGYGAECTNLPGGNCLILLPGGLDRELFAHRLSRSAGQTIRCQWSTDDVSGALRELDSGGNTAE